MIANRSFAARFVLVLTTGVVLWATANRLSHTHEPWDSPSFWYFYLMALALSAMFGFAFQTGAWLWGVTIVFAQLPIMFAQSGPIGPLIGVGIFFLALLSLPAALASAAFSHVAKQVRAS